MTAGFHVLCESTARGHHRQGNDCRLLWYGPADTAVQCWRDNQCSKGYTRNPASRGKCLEGKCNLFSAYRCIGKAAKWRTGIAYPPLVDHSWCRYPRVQFYGVCPAQHSLYLSIYINIHSSFSYQFLLFFSFVRIDDTISPGVNSKSRAILNIFLFSFHQTRMALFS